MNVSCFVKQHINQEFPLRNEVRSIFPEEFVTKFILKMVFFVAQANNIDTVSPQCPKPASRLKISRQI